MILNSERTKEQERLERRAKLAAQAKKIQMQKLQKNALQSRSKLSMKLQRDLGISSAATPTTPKQDILSSVLQKKLLKY